MVCTTHICELPRSASLPVLVENIYSIAIHFCIAKYSKEISREMFVNVNKNVRRN